MSEKHTPKWNITWGERDNTWPGLFQLEETGPLIYGMDGEEGIYTNDESVFHLIAAAPKMLMALEDILDFLKSHGYDTRIVKETIRKARGE